MVTIEQVRGLVFGLAVGDALGVPVEFEDRRELAGNPITELCGYGTYNVPAGSWSDDTSLSLALLESLGRLGHLDYEDVMTNFSDWMNDAAFTPTDHVFDIGNVTRKAISRYDGGTAAAECGCGDAADNGNGSLMRIGPMALYLYDIYGEALDGAEPLGLVHGVSSLTHAHVKSCMACGIYVLLAGELLAHKPVAEAVAVALQKAREFYMTQPAFFPEVDTYGRLWCAEFKDLPEQKIRSTGYVVHTLEAAIWCLLNTADYRSCVLRAVNLGSDTDTVGSVAGGLAGLAYGYESIPTEWRDGLKRKEYIASLCDLFIRSREK